MEGEESLQAKVIDVKAWSRAKGAALFGLSGNCGGEQNGQASSP